MPDMPSTEHAVPQVVLQFVRSNDWRIAGALLAQQPALLEPGAIVYLDRLIATAHLRRDFAEARHLAICRDVLIRAKTYGHEAAIAAVEQPASDELLTLIATFVNAPNWETTRDILDGSPELLSLEAASALEVLIELARAARDPQRERILLTHRDLLHIAGEFGIDEAFDNLPAPVDQALLRAIAELVYAPNPQAAKELLAANPHLLKDATLAIIDGLIEDAAAEDEAQMAMMLSLQREFLHNVRTYGIEEGVRRADLAPSQAVMHQVAALVGAESLDEVKQRLRENDMLLTEEAESAITTLIRAAEVNRRADLAHNLSVYRQLIRLVREAGLEQALASIEGPETLLEMIAETSVMVLEDGGAAVLQGWLAQLGEFYKQAAAVHDEPMQRLTAAIAQLLQGADPYKISPGLEGAFEACWQRIVAARHG